MSKLKRWERSLSTMIMAKEDGELVFYTDVETKIQAYIVSLEADRAALQSEIACHDTTLSPLHVKTKIAGLTLAIDKAKVMLG